MASERVGRTWGYGKAERGRSLAVFPHSVLMTLMCVASLYGFHPDYFPLQLSNQWIYRREFRGTVTFTTWTVSGFVTIGQHNYAHIEQDNPRREFLLRLSSEGQLFEYDQTAQREKLWVDFAAPVGENWVSEIDPCTRLGRIVSRQAKFQGAIGEFQNALEVRYEPSCADAGLLRELYLPYVGLILRSRATIAGPATDELVYARLGGVTYVRAPELQLSLALDQHTYRHAAGGPAPTLRARLTLSNHYLPAVRLEFPSSQHFDAEIRDASGRVVRRWSEGKAFLPVVQWETLGFGEKNYLIELPLTDSAGNALPPGRYVLEAWLTAVQRSLRCSASFEITSVPTHAVQ